MDYKKLNNSMEKESIKKYIIKNILFLAIGIVILYIIDYPISIALRPLGQNIVWKNIYENKIDADIVFFGSSRALRTFDAGFIEKATKIKSYNLGITNAKIEISTLCLHEYLKHCTHKPKYAFLEVGYLTMDSTNNFDNHFQLFPYLLFNREGFNFIKNYNGFKEYYLYLPLIRYSGYFKKLANMSMFYKGENPEYGFFPYDWHWNQYVSFTSQDSTRVIPLTKSKKKYLDSFVELCRNNEIELYLIYVPEHKNYPKYYCNKDSIIEYYRNYAQNNDLGFKDFSADTIFNKDTALFYNVEHVNKKGAEKFTKEYFIPYLKEKIKQK